MMRTRILLLFSSFITIYVLSLLFSNFLYLLARVTLNPALLTLEKQSTETAMVSPALQIGPEASAVPLKTESPVSTVGGISGIYRSLEVQDDSKTPYSDATQVREQRATRSLAAAFAIAPVPRAAAAAAEARSVESSGEVSGRVAGS